jgi:PAS domain-containing protein
MRALQRLPEVVELLTFVTAVDERSIRRAAARLHVSPAAVAKRLDNLEAVVGKPLLVRSPRGLVPTLDGTDFYNRAVDVLDSTAALVGDRRDEAAETLRRVRKVLGRQVPRPTHAILVDTERLLANTLDILSEGVAILGPDDVLLEANDAFSEVVGVDRAALVGRRIDGLEASRWADRERGQAQIDAGAGPLPVEYDARRVEVSTREIVLVRIRDLTVEERLELHLRRQERFPALGRLLASAPTETMVDATLAALRDELRLDSAHLLETDDAGRPTSGPQRL